MKKLFEERKQQFKNFLKLKRRLPNTWEISFEDGEDYRLWFDNLLKLDFDFSKSFVSEVYSMYNIRTLNELERELEFIEFKRVNSSPLYQGEHYFSDGLDMFKWVYPISDDKKNFFKFIRKVNNDYYYLDIAEFYPGIKDEIINLIKKLKHLPDYNEIQLSNGIDARIVINKLMTLDPDFVEKLLLHLSTYNKNSLSINERVNAYLMAIENLGYKPYLQECRFIDGTDMYTWVNRYENIIPNLKEEIDSRIIDNSR